MSEVKVSKQEEILYGPYAPLVRRLGNAAAIAGEAIEEAARMVTESREADGATTGPKDPHGRSPHTAWLDELYESVFDAGKGVEATYRAVARISSEKYEAWRRGATEAHPQSPPLTGETVVLGVGEFRATGYRGPLEIVCSPDLDETAKAILQPDETKPPFPCSWIADESLPPGTWRMQEEKFAEVAPA